MNLAILWKEIKLNIIVKGNFSFETYILQIWNYTKVVSEVFDLSIDDSCYLKKITMVENTNLINLSLKFEAATLFSIYLAAVNINCPQWIYKHWKNWSSLRDIIFIQ